MRKTLYCFIILFLISCNSWKSPYFEKLYKDMNGCVESGDFETHALLSYRLQIDYLKYFDFRQKEDTIFILEYFGIQGNISISIWNQVDTLSFSNEQGHFVEIEKLLFPKTITHLVSNWDVPEIKVKSDESSILPKDIVLATRIIFHERKYQLDCYQFYYFQ